VATRRLRSDLRTFRDLLDPEWALPLREELRWLGGALGEARDADVLLERLQSRAGSIPATEAPGVAQVIDALAQRRKEAHASLLECLRTERYVVLLDRVVDAARAPAMADGADTSLRSVLSGLLDRPWGHLRSAVKDAGTRPTDEQLHAIRIRAKRVRYAAEAVAPMLGKPTKRFAEAAADLQTILGEHNDAVVAEAWLRSWAADGRSGDAAFAAGMLAGIERAAAQTARDRWRKAWKAVAAARGDR
jgi:CHAD domain-containing protein